jgi:hypothetical protein
MAATGRPINLHMFFQEGVGGKLAVSKKAGFPQILFIPSLPLQFGQAAGQGFGVGEEGGDRGFP